MPEKKLLPNSRPSPIHFHREAMRMRRWRSFSFKLPFLNSSLRSDKKAKTPKAKKDPNAPKKPLSAYIIFTKERRSAVVAENPGLSLTEVTKELGARWKAIGAEEKSVFEAKAKEDKERYAVEMEAYEATQRAAA